MRKLPDGDIFYLSGTYREVRRPARLVYSWRSEAEPELAEVVVTHELFPSEQVRGDHDKGWNGCLDRLADALAG